MVRLDIPPPRTDDGEKFAFVEYKEMEDCARALEELNGKTLPFSEGRLLTVQLARSDPYATRSRGAPRSRSRRGRRGGGPGYRDDDDYGRGVYDDGYGPPPPRRGRGYGAPPPARGDYRGYDREDRFETRDRRDYAYDRGERGREGYGSRDREGYGSRDRGYGSRDREGYGSLDREGYGSHDKQYATHERYSRSPLRSPARRDRSRSPVRSPVRSPARSPTRSPARSPQRY